MASWEIRGYGTPSDGLDAVDRHDTAHEWVNMEAGGHPPTDDDIANSTEVVIFSEGVYYTVHTDFISDLDTLDEYVDDVFLQEYEDAS